MMNIARAPHDLRATLARNLLIHLAAQATVPFGDSRAMRDRRTQQRSRTYLGAQAVHDQRYCATDCLIRNMSPAGARLIFAGRAMIPSVFDLITRPAGPSRRVQVVWRLDYDVGVRFIDHRDAAAPLPLDAAQRIRALKAENDALRRRVRDLSESAI